MASSRPSPEQGRQARTHRASSRHCPGGDSAERQTVPEGEAGSLGAQRGLSDRAQDSCARPMGAAGAAGAVGARAHLPRRHPLGGRRGFELPLGLKTPLRSGELDGGRGSGSRPCRHPGAQSGRTGRSIRTHLGSRFSFPLRKAFRVGTAKSRPELRVAHRPPLGGRRRRRKCSSPC